MYERIKQLRKRENLTQEEFAKRINISRANLGSIEVGRTNITDRVIADICREFNVSEEWIRTGEGDIDNPYDEDSELEYLIGALGAKNNKFKKKYITFMLKRPDEYWDMLEKQAYELNEYLNKK